MTTTAKPRPKDGNPLVTVRLPERDRQRLREAAAARGMTQSELMRYSLIAQGVPLGQP